MRLAAKASVAFVLQELGVVVRGKQLVELVRLGRFDHEQPAFAEGILVDGLGPVGQARVWLSVNPTRRANAMCCENSYGDRQIAPARRIASSRSFGLSLPSSRK